MSMFEVSRVSAEIGGSEISFETGKLARQAGGAVVVTAGETLVLCTATVGNLRDVDFLPLTVDVEDKHYAAGKIPGSFFRREARAGEKATLTARMIDRPVRPLFPKGWHYETQLVCQPMSVDHVHPYDILAMNGASAALAISPIPVEKYVGAVRIGKLDGDFVVNPEEESLEDLAMDLVVSGSDEAILMVECGSDGVSEAEVLDALDIAHSEIKTLISAMEDLRGEAGKDKIEVEIPEVDESVLGQIAEKYGAKLDEATQVPEKLARQDAIDAVEEQALAELAERALTPTIPDEEEFPYVVRVVSDTLESNGSSSMGSVCASSMALQAAGVPVSTPVAGVAMGLIKEGDDYVVLTDIAGVEDHLGDMDFKVAGSRDGITALQMDIKITGVTTEILRNALDQANKGRMFILDKMAESIEGPRESLSEHAPQIESIKIDPEKIGAVIGKGGETIRGMQEEFEAEIDIDDDGTVRVYAPSGALVEAAIGRIEAMTREAEVGDRFKGKVVKTTTTFGAFVELVKGTDGLLHISNVKPGERVDTVDDVLNRGDEIEVRVVEVDRERGRVGLRLAEDPDIAGKSAEELAGVGKGDKGPRRD